jgi:hypothetical protein
MYPGILSTSLIINVHYMDILAYNSHYKCTLPGHPGLQVSLPMYITWKSWSTNLILNVHYPVILIYKFHYKCTDAQVMYIYTETCKPGYTGNVDL